MKVAEALHRPKAIILIMYSPSGVTETVFSGVFHARISDSSQIQSHGRKLFGAVEAIQSLAASGKRANVVLH